MSPLFCEKGQPAEHELSGQTKDIFSRNFTLCCHWTVWVVKMISLSFRQIKQLILHKEKTWYFSDRASWIDYLLITNLMHWLLFIIKYYFPLHVSSLKCSSSGGYSCIYAAYGTVNLYDSSWRPVGTQLEWELSLKLCTDRPPGTVTVPYAACIQLYPPEDEHLRLETCRGI